MKFVLGSLRGVILRHGNKQLPLRLERRSESENPDHACYVCTTQVFPEKFSTAGRRSCEGPHHEPEPPASNKVPSGVIIQPRRGASAQVRHVFKIVTTKNTKSLPPRWFSSSRSAIRPVRFPSSSGKVPAFAAKNVQATYVQTFDKRDEQSRRRLLLKTGTTTHVSLLTRDR